MNSPSIYQSTELLDVLAVWSRKHMAASHPIDRHKQPVILSVCLIKPSRYDDEGFVVRYWRGVLPNNTVACFQGLTENIRQCGLLGDVDLHVRVFDEAVMQFRIQEIVDLHRSPGQQVLAALVGVQTNQFCRAADIASALRREGIPVIIGGFHVSGMIAMFPELSAEIRQLLDSGVAVFAGEVEDRWLEVLRDALEGNLKAVYNFLRDPPNLSCAPVPVIDKRYLRNFVASKMATLDCSRGCPFHCSFCTIINVHGRTGIAPRSALRRPCGAGTARLESLFTSLQTTTSPGTPRGGRFSMSSSDFAKRRRFR